MQHDRFALPLGRDSRTRSWNAETGEGSSVVENSWCENLLWTPDGQRLLTVSGGTVRVWDVATGRENVAIVVPWTGRGEPFFALDGLRLARVGLNTIRVCTLPADVAERRRARLQQMALETKP